MTVEFHIRHLLMEVETVQESQQVIAANIRMITADLASAKSIMEELRATWQGDAAFVLFQLYDPIIIALEEDLGKLKAISDLFQNEIPAWEEMAQHLAGTS
jgi:hypothetical protein